MSGTVQSAATVIAEFPDNTTGQILPVNVRNLAESAFGEFQSDLPPNLMPNPLTTGAVVGTSGGAASSFSGTLPAGWFVFNQGTLVGFVAGIGVTSQGFPYVDLDFSGTSSTTSLSIGLNGNDVPHQMTLLPSTAYIAGAWVALLSGSATSFSIGADAGLSGGGSATFITQTISLTGTLQGFSASGTTAATANSGNIQIAGHFTSGVSVAFRLRIAHQQVLLSSTATSSTASISDRGTTKKIDSPSAYTITLPASTFASGQTVAYRQVGAGQVVVAGASGVSLTSTGTVTGGTYATRKQGSRIIATVDNDLPNLWWIDGDLA